MFTEFCAQPSKERYDSLSIQIRYLSQDIGYKNKDNKRANRDIIKKVLEYQEKYICLCLAEYKIGENRIYVAKDTIIPKNNFVCEESVLKSLQKEAVCIYNILLILFGKIPDIPILLKNDPFTNELKSRNYFQNFIKVTKSISNF